MARFYANENFPSVRSILTSLGRLNVSTKRWARETRPTACFCESIGHSR